MSEISDVNEISSVNFRNKETGWKNFSFKLDRNGKQGIFEYHRDNKYMRLFLSDICLRPSCHDCKYKDVKRLSDISLGDCWGIENVLPEMDDDKGTSVILVHTDKANKLIDKLISNDEIQYAEAELDKVLPPSADPRKSVKAHPNREKFFRNMGSGKAIDELVKYASPTMKMKVKRVIWKIKRFVKKVMGK